MILRKRNYIEPISVKRKIDCQIAFVCYCKCAYLLETIAWALCYPLFVRLSSPANRGKTVATKSNSFCFSVGQIWGAAVQTIEISFPYPVDLHHLPPHHGQQGQERDESCLPFDIRKHDSFHTCQPRIRGCNPGTNSLNSRWLILIGRASWLRRRTPTTTESEERAFHSQKWLFTTTAAHGSSHRKFFSNRLLS